jgi:hypothetical protein
MEKKGFQQKVSRRGVARTQVRAEEVVADVGRVDLGRAKKRWLCKFFVGYPPFFLTDFFVQTVVKSTVSWMFACIPYWEQKTRVDRRSQTTDPFFASLRF